MAFEFRLQKLLAYRENKQKLAEEELARRQQELLAVRRELERLQQQEQQLLQNRFLGKDLKIPELILRDNYNLLLQENFRKCAAELQRSEERVKRQRRAVLDAWQSCRVLSVLREKAYGQYREEQKVKEQRLHDELGLNTFLKRDTIGDWLE